jgi:hypothetical protein
VLDIKHLVEDLVEIYLFELSSREEARGPVRDQGMVFNGMTVTDSAKRLLKALTSALASGCSFYKDHKMAFSLPMQTAAGSR